jgi:CubicO group peptidase (beta-lactamase class C family)
MFTRVFRVVPIVAVALAALADPPGAAARGAATGEDAALARRVDAYTKPLLERGDLSGQLLVARQGRIVLERSYGFADRELGVAVTPDTRFNIASITKPMTVIAAIGLIQEGRLAPSDSIARWIPDFPKADSIRVTHLLNHRSGIPHEAMPDSEMTQPLTAAGVVEILKHRPLEFPVGSRESYSSGGFEVLARVLELASGRSYAELLDQWVFGPAGMAHSVAAPNARTILPGRACAYVPGPHGLENAPFQDFSGLVGAGSAWSTARDLHALVQAIVAGRMVRGARESYVRRGHLDFNGRTGGFKAWALWDSAGAVEVVFLSNLASGAPDLLKREALALVRGEPVPPTEFPALSREPLPDAALRGWEGDYQIVNGGPHLHLRAHGGALYSNDWVLLPTTDGAMFSPRDYGLVRAIRGPDGGVASLDWQLGQDHYEAPRVDAP